jgi:hypothetical protein
VFTGCIQVYAPALRRGDHHAGIDMATPDERCFGCHEPETDAMARLMDLSASARQREMDRMMGDGGASLVAKWMVDDPRGCVQCHGIRGTP